MDAGPVRKIASAGAAAVPVGGRSRDERRRSVGAQFAPRVARRLSVGYSRFVGAMKILLPVGALALVAIVAAWPYIQPSDSRFRIGFATLVSSEAQSPNIINPRLVGTDSSDQPFSITADMAKNFQLREDFWQNGAPVELEMPKADVTLEDGTWLVLTANSGLLIPQTKTLDLLGKVNLFHDSGYELHTEKATVDLKAGVAESNDPVEGQGPFGHLKAEGMRLLDKGKTILFTGKAQVTLYPGAGNPES